MTVLGVNNQKQPHTSQEFLKGLRENLGGS